MESTGNLYCWTRGQWTRGRLLALVAGSLLRLLLVALLAARVVAVVLEAAFVVVSSWLRLVFGIFAVSVVLVFV